MLDEQVLALIRATHRSPAEASAALAIFRCSLRECSLLGEGADDGDGARAAAADTVLRKEVLSLAGSRNRSSALLGGRALSFWEHKITIECNQPNSRKIKVQVRPTDTLLTLVEALYPGAYQSISCKGGQIATVGKQQIVLRYGGTRVARANSTLLELGISTSAKLRASFTCPPGCSCQSCCRSRYY